MIGFMEFRKQVPDTNVLRQFGLGSICCLGMLAVVASVAKDARGEWGASHDAAVKIEKGFLFVEGEFVAPPFEIRHDSDAILIGDRRISADEFMPEPERSFTPRRVGFDGGRRFFGRGPRMRFGLDRRDWQPATPASRLIGQLRDLNTGLVCVLYKDEEPLFLEATGAGQDLVEQLLAREGDATAVNLAPAVSEHGTASVHRLLTEMDRTPEFVDYATGRLKAFHSVQTENDRLVEASLLIDRLSFPLTVIAMVLVVLAFGHLLANSPTQMNDALDAESANRVRGVITKSLCFIGLLSIIDLVWTLAASQAGTMRELNPLGQSFIEDPFLLILFKATVTSLSIGLLYALHRFPIAQRAAWWCCLILTLLTARWLTFQSMFI